MEMDFRALYGEPEGDEIETIKKPGCTPYQLKPGEDTKYLDLHIRSRRKGAIAHSKVANSNRKASTVILSQPECFSCRMRHG